MRQKLEPSHSNAPFLYGVPKVHKADIPMRPIRGSPTYNLANIWQEVLHCNPRCACAPRVNDRAAMGSPLSPKSKHNTFNVASIWLQYIDDTFSLWPHGPEELSLFLKHINSIKPSIQFTMEVEDRKIPFLDVLVVKDNGRIRTEVYLNQLTLTGTLITTHSTSRRALSELDKKKRTNLQCCRGCRS